MFCCTMATSNFWYGDRRTALMSIIPTGGTTQITITLIGAMYVVPFRYPRCRTGYRYVITALVNRSTTAGSDESGGYRGLRELMGSYRRSDPEPGSWSPQPVVRAALCLVMVWLPGASTHSVGGSGVRLQGAPVSSSPRSAKQIGPCPARLPGLTLDRPIYLQMT